MLTARIIEQPDEWAALADAWNALGSESPTDTPFITHEWLSLWWRWFASPGDRLRVVAAFRDGRLCAAAPLYWRREKTMGLPVRALRSLTNPHTPKYDWLWRQADTEAVTAVLEAICRQADWDVLRLDYVPSDSATLPMLAGFGAQTRLRTLSEWCMSSPYVRIQGSWQEYEASLSHNFRSHTRQAERKLHQMGKLEVVDVSGGPGLEAALRQAYAVEQSSWKGEAGTAIADHPNEERFYTELAAAASKGGWFRLFLLTLDGRPIAFYYCLDYKRTMKSVKIGYDPAFGKHSPGTVLKGLILKPLFDRHTHDKFDMLGAATPYKLRWGKELQELRSVYMFRRGPRARLAYELQFGMKQRLERYPRVREALRGVKARLTAAKASEATE